jgi:hypothetical protein
VLDRPDQAEVALVDQVGERHAAAGEAPGHRHHQPQVGLQQVLPGSGANLGGPLQVDALARGQPVAGLGQLQLGGQARLDPLGQFGLLIGGEPRHLADLRQVIPDRLGVACLGVGCLSVAGFGVLAGLRVEVGREQVRGILAVP